MNKEKKILIKKKKWLVKKGTSFLVEKLLLYSQVSKKKIDMLEVGGFFSVDGSITQIYLNPVSLNQYKRNVLLCFLNFALTYTLRFRLFSQT